MPVSVTDEMARYERQAGHIRIPRPRSVEGAPSARHHVALMPLDHRTVMETFEAHKTRIVNAVPSAIINLSGTGLVEGLVSNDVDIVVLAPRVESVAEALATIYPPLHPDEWRDNWAAFRDPGPPQVDVVVTVPGSKGDLHHRRAWDVLARRLDLQQEYADLREGEGDSAEAKRAFFERVAAIVGADRLTLDTNLLQEYLREQQRCDVVAQLFDLARAGDVELAVTARINEDMTGELGAKLNELMATGVVGQIGSVTRVGYWILGRDMLGSDNFIAAQEAADVELVRRGRKEPPDFRDWDHVHAHFLHGRDVFLTWDKRLLEATSIIAGQFGIRAMTPEDYLASRAA